MKLIGLVPVRNVASIVEQCVRALAMLCDEIVVLDDCSDDGTLPLLQKLAGDCKISAILTKETWHRDEPADRNRLLEAGRKLKGTHFAVIDADEAFTASWVTDGNLRKQISKLKKGDRLAVRWIHPWRSFDYVRWDDSIHTNQFKEVIFKDDGKARYESDFIHTQRWPNGLSGSVIRADAVDEGLLHFQFVNWRNVLIKQVWYQCLERVRIPDRSIKEITERYAFSCDEQGLGLRPTPPNWLSGYPFHNRTGFDEPDTWRLDQIHAWFAHHGIEYFRKLDIWHPEIWKNSTPEIAALLQKSRWTKVKTSGNLAGDSKSSREIDTLRNARDLLQAQFDDLRRNFKNVEQDRATRGEVIERQGREHTALQAEFDRRLKELNALYPHLEALKNAHTLLQAQYANLQKNFAAVEADRNIRGEVIERQGREHTALQAEFDRRLKELNSLYPQFEALKNERSLLQAQLADLQKNFAAVEADRNIRGEVIERQGREHTALQAEFDLRLKELNALYPQLEALKNERNLLRAQLADLQRNFDIAENDRIHRGKVIEQQGREGDEARRIAYVTEVDRDAWRGYYEKTQALLEATKAKLVEAEAAYAALKTKGESGSVS